MLKGTNSRAVILLAAGALMSCVAASLVCAQVGEKAEIIVLTVRLPGDAVLFIDDHRTQETGGVRAFRTPPMPAGGHYAYTLMATSNGKEVTRKIHLAHGVDNVFDLRAEFLPAAKGRVHPKEFSAQSSTDPLPSWNEGPAKKAILEFVRTTTDKASPNYLPLAQRIATFDNDGTLWVEQPLYTQFVFALDRVKALAPQHADWKTQEPFKAILAGDREAMAKFTKKDLLQVLAATSAGMSTEQFRALAKDWLATAKHPRFKRLYTECVYQPMLEVMRYLRASGFKTYIVTGGGQEFVRVFSEQTYGIPREQVIGSALKLKYTYKDGQPVMLRLPALLLLDDEEGKPEDIELFIGRKPAAAFGNSDGDRQMLEWTQSGAGARFMMLIHHDDARREFAYGPNSKVGTFSDALMAEATKRGWVVVSMKNDWQRIFGFEK